MGWGLSKSHWALSTMIIPRTHCLLGRSSVLSGICLWNTFWGDFAFTAHMVTAITAPKLGDSTVGEKWAFTTALRW